MSIENQIEEDLIKQLRELKYIYVPPPNFLQRKNIISKNEKKHFALLWCAQHQSNHDWPPTFVKTGMA